MLPTPPKQDPLKELEALTKLLGDQIGALQKLLEKKENHHG